jgi:hypothetical protein
VVRNYEGYMSAYVQPEHYTRHDPATCPTCRAHAQVDHEPGQAGVSALLNGTLSHIAPEGFNSTHQRQAHMSLNGVQPHMNSSSEPNGNGISLSLEPDLQLAPVSSTNGHSQNGQNGQNGINRANGRANRHAKGTF